MNIGKNFFWMALVFSALLLACSPTEVSAQTSVDEQRLLGSWTDMHTDVTIVFNADGTVTGIPTTWYGFAATNWAAADGRIVIFRTGGWGTSFSSATNFYISSDGRTLIIGTLAFRRN